MEPRKGKRKTLPFRNLNSSQMEPRKGNRSTFRNLKSSKMEARKRKRKKECILEI